MTKRERVTAAFQGKETDHVPVCMWKHVPQQYWGDDRDFAACQLEAYKATDVDFMKLSGDKYFTWPAPVLENIGNADELYKIEPLGPMHPYIRGQIERTRRVVDALGPDCVTLYLIFAPLSYLRLKIGYPAMMRLIRENPEAMKYACGVIGEDVKTLVRGILQTSGADGVFYSVQNGEENRFYGRGIQGLGNAQRQGRAGLCQQPEQHERHSFLRMGGVSEPPVRLAGLQGARSQLVPTV